MSEVRLGGRWQASSLTKIRTGMAAVTIDLCEAEFDGWDVEIVVQATMGASTVVAPRGPDVRRVGLNGAVNTTVEPPVPGFPVVRLSATSGMGTIRVVHPAAQTQRLRRRRRRRQPGTPTLS